MQAGLGKQATNDIAESPFAGMKDGYWKFDSQMNPMHASAWTYMFQWRLLL